VERIAPLLAAKMEPRGDDGSEVLLTPREAAARASVHVETIRRHVRSGALSASRVGKAVRIAPKSLDVWLAGAWPDASESRGGRSRVIVGRRPLADALAKLNAVEPGAYSPVPVSSEHRTRRQRREFPEREQ
jgi:excisionase family DNA binding protein